MENFWRKRLKTSKGDTDALDSIPNTRPVMVVGFFCFVFVSLFSMLHMVYNLLTKVES